MKADEDTSLLLFNIQSASEQFGDNAQINRFIRRLAMTLLLTSEAYSNLFKYPNQPSVIVMSKKTTLSLYNASPYLNWLPTSA